MQRWHAESALARRRARAAARMRGDAPRFGQAGRYRKRDAYDCGNARCGCCHSDKFPARTPTPQEARAALALREWAREQAAGDC